MFIEKNPYKLQTLSQMHSNCPSCGLDLERETGFYYGAMYVSYAITVALSVSIAVAYYVLFQFELVKYLIINFCFILLLFPLIYRISRAVWISFFVSFDEKFS